MRDGFDSIEARIRRYADHNPGADVIDFGALTLSLAYRELVEAMLSGGEAEEAYERLGAVRSLSPHT